MNEKFTSNHFENDEIPLNKLESDYNYLITRLKDISVIISLLEQTISR